MLNEILEKNDGDLMPHQNLVNHKRRMEHILEHNRKNKSIYNSKYFYQQILSSDLNEKENLYCLLTKDSITNRIKEKKKNVPIKYLQLILYHRKKIDP